MTWDLATADHASPVLLLGDCGGGETVLKEFHFQRASEHSVGLHHSRPCRARDGFDAAAKEPNSLKAFKSDALKEHRVGLCHGRSCTPELGDAINRRRNSV